MNAHLKRIWYLTNSTIGELYIDDNFVCYILEDVARKEGVKVPDETCIPSGLNYKIGKCFSARWKTIVPVIYTKIVGKGDSPDDYRIIDDYGNEWSAVEIHPGNDHTNTDACQLPGMEKDLGAQRVLYSHKACDVLFPMLFKELETAEFIPYQIEKMIPMAA